MTYVKAFDKDPDAILDYTVDWALWLESGETISTSTWIIDTGITQGSTPPSISGSKATVWLQGGTTGINYGVTNRIVTSAGRTDDRSILIRCTQR